MPAFLLCKQDLFGGWRLGEVFRHQLPAVLELADRAGRIMRQALSLGVVVDELTRLTRLGSKGLYGLDRAAGTRLGVGPDLHAGDGRVIKRLNGSLGHGCEVIVGHAGSGGVA